MQLRPIEFEFDYIGNDGHTVRRYRWNRNTDEIQVLKISTFTRVLAWQRVVPDRAKVLLPIAHVRYAVAKSKAEFGEATHF